MRTEEQQKPIAEERETGRLEAFSDGVFAVAITLLVLDIKVPAANELGEGRNLLHALGHQWPVYLAFLTSFATILIMWVNHHNLFRQIVRADHTFLLLNGSLLLVVTVIPFATSLLAAYLEHPDAKAAALIYALVNVCMATAFNLLWRYAARDGRLLSRNADQQFVRDVARQHLFGVLSYVVAVVLALFTAIGSFVYLMLLALFFAFPPSLTRRVRRPSVGVERYSGE